MKTTKLALVSSLFLIACGGGSGGGAIDVDSLGAESTVSFCGKTFECCTAVEIMEKYALFGSLNDEADCVTKVGAFASGLPDYQASIDAGKLIFHADLAGDCLAAQDSASCNAFAIGDVASSACDRTFEGLVANDAACDFDEECVSQFCQGFDKENNIPGTCKVLPTVGEPCPDFECAVGAFCQFGSDSSCVAVQADGESCNSDEECTKGCNFANDVGTCGALASCNGL